MCTMGRWSFWQIDPLLMKICTKNNFYIFVHSDLELCPLDIKISPLYSYSCTALCFRYFRKFYGFPISRMDGQGASLNAAPWRRPHNDNIHPPLPVISQLAEPNRTEYVTFGHWACTRFIFMYMSKMRMRQLLSLVSSVLIPLNAINIGNTDRGYLRQT